MVVDVCNEEGCTWYGEMVGRFVKVHQLPLVQLLFEHGQISILSKMVPLDVHAHMHKMNRETEYKIQYG